LNVVRAPIRTVLAGVAIGVAVARPIMAGEVLDRVRRDGVVRCAAGELPGLAAPRTDGGIDGIAVELCRAVAAAAPGREGRIAFTLEDMPQDTPDNIDVAFVPRAETAPHSPFIMGPAVFVDRLSVLVPRGSSLRTPSDLAGQTVCLMIGSPEQRGLETAVRRLRLDIVRLTFEEVDEMRDAYFVGRCGAMAGHRTELQTLRGETGVNRLTSRLLTKDLASVSIRVATPTTDRAWAMLVFRVVLAALDNKGLPAGR
jgi:general L-amino acid transport system substrate-binding protein